MATRIDGTTDEHMSYYDLERAEYEKMFPGLDKNLRDVALRAKQFARHENRSEARKLRRLMRVLAIKNDATIERIIRKIFKLSIIAILVMLAYLIIHFHYQL